MTVMKEQAVGTDWGCYSIEYPDPADSDWRFSMDYDWHTKESPAKNRWTCSESPISHANWRLLRDIPDHGYRAVLKDFGLDEYEISFAQLITTHPSPADLARIRRAKEVRGGLAYKIIMNMRRGCPRGELADTFEARQ